MAFDPSLVCFLAATIIVGLLILISISISRKGGHKFDKENYQIDFMRIENTLVEDNKLSYAIAVIEGDKILDRALTELRLPGRTMGDRLKKIDREKFSDINAVWRAHKLLNQIAHESNFKVEFHQAKKALSVYKQAL